MVKRYEMCWSLDDLHDELLSGKPEAILPDRLSDEWLERLCGAADLAVQGRESDRGYREAFDALVAVTARGIRAARREENPNSLPQDEFTYVTLRELWQRALDYRIALTQERGARSAGLESRGISIGGLFASRQGNWHGVELGAERA